MERFNQNGEPRTPERQGTDHRTPGAPIRTCPRCRYNFEYRRHNRLSLCDTPENPVKRRREGMEGEREVAEALQF